MSGPQLWSRSAGSQIVLKDLPTRLKTLCISRLVYLSEASVLYVLSGWVSWYEEGPWPLMLFSSESSPPGWFRMSAEWPHVSHGLSLRRGCCKTSEGFYPLILDQFRHSFQQVQGHIFLLKDSHLWNVILFNFWARFPISSAYSPIHRFAQSNKIWVLPSVQKITWWLAVTLDCLSQLTVFFFHFKNGVGCSCWWISGRTTIFPK